MNNEIRPNDMDQFIEDGNLLENNLSLIEEQLSINGMEVEESFVDEDDGSLIFYIVGENASATICDTLTEMQYDRIYDLDLENIQEVLYNVDDNLYQYFVPLKSNPNFN